MRGIDKESTNINVEMPMGFYRAFCKKERELGYGTHLSFFEGMVAGKTDVCWIQLLEVDGEEPTKHTVQLLHGEALYSISNGRYTLIGERTGDNVR